MIIMEAMTTVAERFEPLAQCTSTPGGLPGLPAGPLEVARLMKHAASSKTLEIPLSPPKSVTLHTGEIALVPTT